MVTSRFTMNDTKNDTPNDNCDLPMDEITSSSSNSDDTDIRKEIASWVVNTGTPAMNVDLLLQVLKKRIPELPKTCKTLLRTPKNAYENIIPMCKGYYLHIGFQRMLEHFLSLHKISSKKLIVDIGIDGTPSTESSDTELWPIMANVVGFDDVLLIGSYFGSGKPTDEDKSSNEFLTPFVDEVLEILESGGISYEDELYELHFRAFVMDAPARAFIMGTILCTGYNSCTKCVVEGLRIAKRTIFHGTGQELRTDYTFRNRIHGNHHHSSDTTMIEKLPIDCVKNVVVDPMHNVYMGVMKQLMNLWINVRKKAYSISVKNIELLTKRIFAIAKQLPSEFSRTPRTLKHFKRYKATEFRQFTLYTLVVILNGILPEKYYNHFLKFHCAIRILCTPKDCIKNNDLAHELLEDFVREFGSLYEYRSLSHNVHSLLHLAEDVRNLNCPLDSYSAFKFENFLQYLKKLCRNNYRVLEQISNRYFEKFFVSNYEGDFKKRSNQDKTDVSGNITDIYKYNMHLSIKSPNNYVLSDNCIFEIQKIVKNEDGSFDEGASVKHLQSLYQKPIPSNLLKIYTSEKNVTRKNRDLIRVTENLRKIAIVNADQKFFYLTLLH